MPKIWFQDPQTIPRISSPSSPVELGTEPHQTHQLKMQTSIQYLVPNSWIHSLSRLFQPLLHQTVHVDARLELNRPRPIPPCLLSQLKPQQAWKVKRQRPNSKGSPSISGSKEPTSNQGPILHRQGHFLELEEWKEWGDEAFHFLT